MKYALKSAFYLAIVIIMTATILSCKKNNHTLTNDELYANAIVDAAKTLTQSDIYYQLIPIVYGSSNLTEWKIDNGDTLLLVNTLSNERWLEYFNISDSIFYSSPDPNYMTWITIPKQLDQYLLADNLSDSATLNMRLKQIIGLPPSKASNTMYQLWVNKNSLLRPSYDNDITTNHAAIDYPKETEQWYKQWLDSNIAYSYENPAQGKNYPFTRLGYTYDWGAGKSKYGPSEYIIKPNSKIKLHKKTGCWNYYQTIKSATRP